MNSVPNLSKYDESQTKFLQDELILVDENDNNIGSMAYIKIKWSSSFK